MKPKSLALIEAVSFFWLLPAGKRYKRIAGISSPKKNAAKPKSHSTFKQTNN